MKKALILFVILTAVGSSCSAAVEQAGPALGVPPAAASTEKRQADLEAIQEQLTRAEITPSTRPPARSVVTVPSATQVPGAAPVPGITPDPRTTPVFPMGASPAPKRESAQVLVIPSPGMKLEEIAAIREDLSIMSRILDRKTGLPALPVLSSDASAEAINMYIAIARGPSEQFRPSATESVYIAGFGALFSMKVDFPLLPVPQAEEPKKSDTDTDNLWEQTKKEMYSPGPDVPRFSEVPLIGQTFYPRQVRGPVYDADKVENLKAALIESLKHASNIKTLKPDEGELIIVAVTGQSNQLYTHPEETRYDVFGTGGGYGYGGGGYPGGGYPRGGYGGGGYGGGGYEGGGMGGYGGVTITAGTSGEDGMETMIFQIKNADPDEVMQKLQQLKELKLVKEPNQKSIIATGPHSAIAQAIRLIGELKVKERSLPQTYLIIRARKADVDKFAKGALTEEQFKQRLEITTY